MHTIINACIHAFDKINTVKEKRLSKKKRFKFPPSKLEGYFNWKQKSFDISSSYVNGYYDLNCAIFVKVTSAVRNCKNNKKFEQQL